MRKIHFIFEWIARVNSSPLIVCCQFPKSFYQSMFHEDVNSQKGGALDNRNSKSKTDNMRLANKRWRLIGNIHWSITIILVIQFIWSHNRVSLFSRFATADIFTLHIQFKKHKNIFNHASLETVLSPYGVGRNLWCNKRQPFGNWRICTTGAVWKLIYM